MTGLIDSDLLNKPEIRAAFPPTARRMILKPIIDYINTLAGNGDTVAALQKSLKETNDRLSALEKTVNVTAAEAMPDLPASPVSISATNLVDIGVLASNENDDRKAINKIFSLLRTHGWMKP